MAVLLSHTVMTRRILHFFYPSSYLFHNAANAIILSEACYCSAYLGIARARRSTCKLVKEADIGDLAKIVGLQSQAGRFRSHCFWDCDAVLIGDHSLGAFAKS